MIKNTGTQKDKMFLHFEDWSTQQFIRQLDAKGQPHVNKLIKVFASDLDPRIVLGRSALVVVESSAVPLADSERTNILEERLTQGKA